MKKILYFIQLPPPTHGVSTINKHIINSKIINDGFITQTLEIKFSNNISELQKITIKKIFKTFYLTAKLIFTIKKFKPDLIYFSIMPVGKGFIRDLLFVLIIKFFKVKPIYHLHNKGIYKAKKSKILKQIYKLVFNNSVIIHLSQGLMDSEVKFLNLKNAKTYVVNNGVEEFEVKLNKKNNNIIKLLYLSNLFPEKGLNTLLDSIKILNEKKYNVQLDIIGSARNDKLIKNVLSNKLNNIYFRGELFNSEKNNYLQVADIFIHPTTNDSFPLVILEAMQFGLPVISTYEGAIPEIIENGINGILIEKGNVVQLAESIELLINSHELRIKMGQNNREKHLEKYTITKFEENISKIIQEQFEN